MTAFFLSFFPRLVNRGCTGDKGGKELGKERGKARADGGPPGVGALDQLQVRDHQLGECDPTAPQRRPHHNTI